jgi:hypothetical protein
MISPALLSASLFAVIASVTLLAHFGLTFGSASLNSSFLIMMGASLLFLLTGALVVHPLRLLAYLAVVAACSASAFVNASWGSVDSQSPTSLLLVLAMYAPLVGRVQTPQSSGVQAQWVRARFSDVALFCAAVAILQYGVQFVFNPPWLFDLGSLLPDVLKSAPGYNTIIPAAQGLKANGLFFKEPSFLSLAMAFGILIEVTELRRVKRMLLMFVALLLSYSGSGLLVLVIGLVFLLRVHHLPRLAALFAVLALLSWALWDVLNLGFTWSRITEFGEPRSSGYMRYVAPVQLLIDNAMKQPWSLLLGHGPGTIARQAETTFYAFHDPTFAKAIFEYGLLGFAAFTALALMVLRGSDSSLAVRAATFACWLGTGGFLLTPEIAYLLMLFGAWLPSSVTKEQSDERSRSANHQRDTSAASKPSAPLAVN